MYKKFIKKIEGRNLTVGIIGLGYVGLPLAARINQTKQNVIGFDIDKTKIDNLKKGKSYIKHIDFKLIKKHFENKLFFPTDDFSHISQCDVIVICVPTPLGKNNQPDISYIQQTIKSISPHVKKGQLITLESTTYPGTTKEEICAYFEEKGFTIGQELFVGYSPEREDPGNLNFNTQNTPKIVGGRTKECINVASMFYSVFIDNVVKVSSLEVAEMAKLLENTYRSVNIGLINEMKVISDKMKIDLYEVIDAASTKPFGFTPFYPGPGIGGHCIPIDPFYLSWKAKEYDADAKFIELAGEVNKRMPDYIVDQIAEILNTRSKALSKSKILILGLSYKKNVDDTRESPSFSVISKLIKKGADVCFSDPFRKKFPRNRECNYQIKSVGINEDIAMFDIIVLMTDHDDFDYEYIIEHSQVIYDTRGRMKAIEKKIYR